MMTTQMGREAVQGVDAMEDKLAAAGWRLTGDELENPNADDLRLLALEIIMYDPELAKQLCRAGVRKVLAESPNASG